MDGVTYDYLSGTVAVNFIGQLQGAASSTCHIDGVFLGRLEIPKDVRVLRVRLDLSCCERPGSAVSQLWHRSHRFPDMVDTYDISDHC